MGSYAFLTIAGYPIHSSRHYYDRWLFEATDRCVERRNKRARNPLIWAPPEPYECDEQETDFLYRLSAAEIRRRLAREGFDRAMLEWEFRRSIDARVARLERLCARGEDPAGVLRTRCAQLRSSRLSAWLDALAAAIEAGITGGRWDAYGAGCDDPLLHALFASDEPVDDRPIHLTAFPCTTLESFAIALFEVLPGDVQGVLDVSNLVNSGWTDDFADLLRPGDEVTSFHALLRANVSELRALLDDTSCRQLAVGGIRANALRTLGGFLAATFKKAVLTRSSVRFRFVSSHPRLCREPHGMAAMLCQCAPLIAEVAAAVDALCFDNPDEFGQRYADLLDVELPVGSMEQLRGAFAWYRACGGPWGGDEAHALDTASAVECETALASLELVESTARSIDEQMRAKVGATDSLAVCP